MLLVCLVRNVEILPFMQLLENLVFVEFPCFLFMNFPEVMKRLMIKNVSFTKFLKYVKKKCLKVISVTKIYRQYNFNSFTPENPQKGHRQTVQTQIRCHIMLRLIRVYSVC